MSQKGIRRKETILNSKTANKGPSRKVIPFTDSTQDEVNASADHPYTEKELKNIENRRKALQNRETSEQMWKKR